jgi:hypothetical protein
MKKQNIKYRLIGLFVSLIVAILLILLNAKGFFIFVSGVAVGALSLMVLRVWLWNTHELIKDKE